VPWWRAGLGHSIRRRALDLVYALVNEGNLQALTVELLEYLKNSDSEFKPDLTDKILCTRPEVLTSRGLASQCHLLTASSQ